MHKKNILLEICVFNITDMVTAVASGADRIELCASYFEGGITPSHALITAAMKITAPENIVVMIRPRGGNFIYDEYEFQVMQHDIAHCKQLGIQNVIFGISLPDGTLDKERNSILVQMAAPMHCTLQRAFDLTPDPKAALETAIECGFRRILTSGGYRSAWEGRDVIKELITAAAGRMEILPGAGINAVNAAELIRHTGCDQIHTSAKKQADQVNTKKEIYDFSHLTEVNGEEVRKLKTVTAGFTL